MNKEDILMEGEELIWEGKPIPGKRNKNTLIWVIFIAFFLLVETFIILSIVFKTGDNIAAFVFTIVCIICIIFFIRLIYKEKYHDKLIFGDKYFVTNKRVIKLEGKNQYLKYTYLEYINDIVCMSYNNRYGQITFKKAGKDEYKFNNEDMANVENITFYSIEYPGTLKKKVNELIKK